MKLTYRGINYHQENEGLKLASIVAKYRLGNDRDANKLIFIKPIHYYTYRGVSYSKNLIFAPKTQLLVNNDPK
ncbi:MAG: DUF4278 domain-containing protein [Waterburya sp.]